MAEKTPVPWLATDGILALFAKRHIHQTITLKPERHEFKEKPGQIVRFMSMTGG